MFVFIDRSSLFIIVVGNFRDISMLSFVDSIKLFSMCLFFGVSLNYVSFLVIIYLFVVWN